MEHFSVTKSQRLVLRLLLVLATVFFMVGISLPLMTLTKFIVLENSFSILSGVSELFLSKHYFLFIIVTAFSVILPGMKILVLFFILSQGENSHQKFGRLLHLMHEYGRWAMLDVMVVAVLIVTVKLGAIASIQVHYGLYVFAAAVVLIMLVTNRVVRISNLTEVNNS